MAFVLPDREAVTYHQARDWDVANSDRVAHYREFMNSGRERVRRLGRLPGMGVEGGEAGTRPRSVKKNGGVRRARPAVSQAG